MTKKRKTPIDNVRQRRADERDADIGRKVRARRLEMGMSQTDLGGLIGVTFQQIQKYEKGVNRIGGGRLGRICETLHVPSSFFIGVSDDKPTNDERSVFVALAQDRGAVRILQAYRKMARAKRSALVDTAEQLAA